ncbi:MAG: hypothetical protein ACK5Y2_03335 [Bdellovibrionales bacterium]
MHARGITLIFGFCLSAPAAFEAPLSLERGLTLSEGQTNKESEPKLEEKHEPPSISKKESKSHEKSDRTRIESRRLRSRSSEGLQAQALRVFEYLNQDPQQGQIQALWLHRD